MIIKKPAVIFDIDGTLADTRHRQFFLEQGKKDWDAFFSNAINDPIKQSVVSVLELYQSNNYEILLCTGRSENYRDITESWLIDFGIMYSDLFMRKLDDRRDDTIIKEEIYYIDIDPYYIVEAVYEDRDRVVNMWRTKIKLPCFQVDTGNF